MYNCFAPINHPLPLSPHPLPPSLPMVKQRRLYPSVLKECSTHLLFPSQVHVEKHAYIRNTNKPKTDVNQRRKQSLKMITSYFKFPCSHAVKCALDVHLRLQRSRWLFFFLVVCFVLFFFFFFRLTSEYRFVSRRHV